METACDIITVCCVLQNCCLLTKDSGEDCIDDVENQELIQLYIASTASIIKKPFIFSSLSKC
jgi:hypothetical protein